MEQNSSQFERLHQLVTSQLEGTLSDDERLELVDLLRDDAAAQQLYVESIEDVTSLRWWCAGIRPDEYVDSMIELAPPQRQRKARRFWSGLAVLAASNFIPASAGLLTLVDWRFEPVKDKPAIAEKNGSNRAADGIGAVATLSRLRGVAGHAAERGLGVDDPFGAH